MALVRPQNYRWRAQHATTFGQHAARMRVNDAGIRVGFSWIPLRFISSGPHRLTTVTQTPAQAIDGRNRSRAFRAFADARSGADSASKLRMSAHGDGQVRAGARSASTKESFADKTRRNLHARALALIAIPERKATRAPWRRAESALGLRDHAGRAKLRSSATICTFANHRSHAWPSSRNINASC